MQRINKIMKLAKQKNCQSPGGLFLCNYNITEEPSVTQNFMRYKQVKKKSKEVTNMHDQNIIENQHFSPPVSSIYHEAEGLCENNGTDSNITMLKDKPEEPLKVLEEALNHNIVFADFGVLQTSCISPENIGKSTYGPHEKLLEVLEDEKSDSNTLDFQHSVNLKKGEQKKHCCFYCNKLIFKVYRHYLTVHKNEKEVQQISVLPTKSKNRLLLLANLRKKGDFIFNSQLKTDDENQIVCKDSTQRIKNVCCVTCKGYYSKYSIRHHIKKSHTEFRKSGRRTTIQPECRKLEVNIHNKASKDLRTKIFPYMHEDMVSNIVRYDEAIIHYGNYLCRKYTEDHHASEIRAHIRNFGKLLLAIKESDPKLQNLIEVLNAKYVNLIIDAIEKVAGKDCQTGLYRAPSTAKSIGTELKKLCKLLQMEYVKSEDKEKQKQMKNLIIVFDSEFHVTVNKIGTETQKINNRRKKTVLPKTEDIAQFRKYLEEKIVYFSSKLERKFSKLTWTRLAEYTLVHLAVFNRKRPGETERLLIGDYLNYEIVGDNEVRDDDLLSREQIKKWARIRFTGKLGKDNALLIHRNIGFKSIDLILKYRELAGVDKLNKYVFGEPSKCHFQQTFKACALIRRIAEESGIKDSQLIRTTLLRQHLATETAHQNVDHRLENRVSDFMSHRRKIHDDYYVMTKKTDDITKVSTLLENFSSTPKEKPIDSTSLMELRKGYPSPYISDDESITDGELTQAELNYVLGKKKNRLSWTTEEKEITKLFFKEEIYNYKKLCMLKVKKFFYDYKSILSRRSPHLIRQWILRERERSLNQLEGQNSSRQRWTTPERVILEDSLNKHSSEGSLPSIPECELLIEQNPILKRRNPSSVKAFIYNDLKKRTTI